MTPPAVDTEWAGMEMRERLLAAAIKCFDRYGIDKTAMEDVAKAAGVSRGSVYRYFNDRRDLVTAVVVERAGAAFGHAREVIARQSSFADQIVEGSLALVERGREDVYLRFLLSPENSHLATDAQTVALNTQTWLPAFEAARADGVLRPGLDLHECLVWLSQVHFMLAARAEFLPQRKADRRRMVRSFVLPALIPDEKAEFGDVP